MGDKAMIQNGSIETMMMDMGSKARKAARIMATASPESKSNALNYAAEFIWAKRSEIMAANARDLQFGREKGLSDAMMDRLLLDETRLQQIITGLQAVAAQQDPIGQVIEEWDRPTGLHIKRVRTPLGVIGVIYESRPNVTVDAGALCLKSGNCVILRGGSESLHSSMALHLCLVDGLVKAGLPEAAIQLVPTRDREAVGQMLTMTDFIDVIVPRGGKGLVGRVQSEARVPVFAHLEGICHIYVDASADPEKARKVVLNAKTRRTGICGAAECVLLHKDIAQSLGQDIVNDLMKAGVEVRAQGVKGTLDATDADWGVEFLDMKIAVKVVDNIAEAIHHIQGYGSNHTESILAEDAAAVSKFFAELDSAILMHNASTQFADGGEFGMGAEIGIATGKLHARGPVGATQLTSFKYLVTGDGTIRT